MDHNFEVLEINVWVKKGYEQNQKCFVVDGSYTTIYNCVCTHIAAAYEPADVFTVSYGGTVIWEPISSTYNGQPSNTDIHVTGMTYNSAMSGNTLTIHQTVGYPDVAVFMPSYALYDHYVSAFTLTGTTLSIYRTGGQSTLTVDLQSIIDIATGVTSTNTYVTGGTLNNSNYHLYLNRNDGGVVDINLYALHDADIYTTGATLSGSIATFRKNAGSPYTLDLSGLVFTGATSGYSGFSGYSGMDGAAVGSGYSGISGYSGESNISGYSGVSGYSGISGVIGASGYSGISGFSGYSGKSGFSGYSGISGFSGYSGISGFSGYSGKSGYSGISGAVGLIGISGYSGISGIIGSTGLSGYSGKSGFSGYSGVQGLYGGASLILNGDGSCTTDWAGNVDYWGISYDESFYARVINNLSGFTDNALRGEYAHPAAVTPNGTLEYSYQLVTGVKYVLTFKYRSNSTLSVFDEPTPAHNIYLKLPANPSSVADASVSFTALNSKYLMFGASSGDTVNDTDWFIIDNVNLRCGSCTGSTGSSLIINNNVNNRVLTANGSTTSIDAEAGLLYKDGNIDYLTNSGAAFFIESFHDSPTSVTGTTLTTTVSGPTHITIRGRGAIGSANGLLTNDMIYEHDGYASYGADRTTDLVKMFTVSAKVLGDLNTASPLVKVEYRIRTKSDSAAVDSIQDRLLIDQNGDVTIFGGLEIDRQLTLSTTTFSSNITGSTYFSYVASVGGTTITFTLPLASTHRGRVYYIALESKGVGNLNIASTGGDTIAWLASPVAVSTIKKYAMLQSDGVSNWLPLSNNVGL